MNLASADFMVDINTYVEPEEILMQLSHKDVVLEMFKGKSKFTESLHAGQERNINNVYAEVLIRCKPIKIVKLSDAFLRKMTRLAEKGYAPEKANIRHIIWWRYEEVKDGNTKTIEVPIVLPEIILRKSTPATSPAD